MSNIVIVADSTCDLSQELIAKHDIKIVPLNVLLDDKNYRDGVDITPDDIYAYHEEHGVLPKTAAINTAEWEEIFKKYTADGSEVVCFTISNEMSATFNNARLAAMEVENVYPVSTGNLSTGIGLQILKACELKAEGKSAREIQEYCTELTETVDASFVIDSLEYLHKGGRCSAVAAFGANLLKLKPLIQVKNGSMGVTKKYRGKYDSVLLEYVIDKLSETDDIDFNTVFVTHAGVDDEIVNSVVAKVKELIPFKNVYVTRAGATISSHCGRNTLGVLFLRKSKLQ